MAMILMVLLAPSVQATPLDDVLPPESLEGGFGNGTVILQWLPPGGREGEALDYRIYHNAELIGQTRNTSHEAPLNGSVNVYHVTTWIDGKESAPSQPLLAYREPPLLRAVEPIHPIETSCEPIGTDVDLNNFPYVFVVLQPECLMPTESPFIQWRG